MAPRPPQPRKGIPVIQATLLAIFIAGTMTAIAYAPGGETGLLTLVSSIIITAALGPLLATPGVCVAYLLLKGCKSAPGLFACALCGGLIGAAVAFLYMPFWQSIEWLRPLAFITGPLAGVIYYALQEKTDQSV